MVTTTTALVRDDPTLRRLLTVTAVDTVGRGAFFTLTSLYLIGVAGLPAVTVGVGLTVAGGVGVLGSLAFGHLADRWSSRRMLVALHVLQGGALTGYVLVRDLPTLILVASLVMLAQQGGASVRSAAIGRAFRGDERVRIRALMRTVTNAGIAAGTALAAIPLAIGSANAYRVTMVAAGLLFLGSAVLLLGLPAARIDARPAPDGPAGPRVAGPYRDRRFLLLAALNGIFGMQFAVYEIAVPLWVVHHTEAPDVLVSPLLLINTALVIALQVRLSRGTADLRGAARAMTWAGWLMALACLLWAVAGELPAIAAVLALLVAAAVHTLAEITSSAAGWSISFELAPAGAIGAYQGVYGTGFALGAMVAPLVVTATAIELGTPGWALLGVLFLTAALATRVVIARIPPTGTPEPTAPEPTAPEPTAPEPTAPEPTAPAARVQEA
ncbi:MULTISPECIES: MFS transporter [Catenuloplanes]|uniref:MFS family arabinose efflux permease n=1 Tax=Catenuloplanes niger TaxID=587534 RepID=A0AAE3ZY95_9ACTN|nr:MFS transporter [Catenuloplanes niger]MDR7327429.1 putative MFS family arabinose efflux permease [Catenuloplanes niger]